MFLQVKEPAQLTALLIDADVARREMFQLTLGSRDIALSESVGTVDEALQRAGSFELVMYYAQRACPDALSDLRRLRARQAAAILVLLETVTHDDIDLLLVNGADHVLPLGLQADRLFVATVSAVSTGRKRREIEKDCEKAQRALQEAQRVSRAKMILIARHGIGEEEAHRRVQKMSMERNLPLPDMAKQIIDAEDLLC